MKRKTLESEAERRIMKQIEALYPSMRLVLAAVPPLEAYALLGNLMVDTVARFPPEERMQLADAWAKTFREGVRDGLAGRFAQPCTTAQPKPRNPLN